MVMNVLSLFSGIGGLELGLERAGMTTVGQVEIDAFCRSVLEKHWPEVPRHDDVRTAVDWWQSKPRPDIDLVAGGFPCQTVSVAGRRRGQADERWLWPAMAAIVRALRPRYVLVENVPGLLAPIAVRDDDGRLVGYVRAPVEDVLGDLATCGYDAEWDCIPAAAVGAPHLRDRVVIVAHTECHTGGVQPVTQPRRCHTAVAGNHGAAQPVADADGRRLAEQPEPDSEPVGQFEPSLGYNAVGLRAALADSDQMGRSRQAKLTSGRWSQPEHGRWWATEPDVGRVAHGVPARMDRLRALGNAVVPQVAEHVGRLIVERERAA